MGVAAMYSRDPSRVVARCFWMRGVGTPEKIFCENPVKYSGGPCSILLTALASSCNRFALPIISRWFSNEPITPAGYAPGDCVCSRSPDRPITNWYPHAGYGSGYTYTAQIARAHGTPP